MPYAVDLTGQVAIVTGGEQGIGAGAVRLLAKSGAKIAVCGLAQPENVAALSEEVKALGSELYYQRKDLTEPKAAKEFVQEVIGIFGRIDIVVNNAGAGLDDWTKTFNVNVVSPLTIIDESVKDMETRGYGRVVNITSSSVFSGGTNSPQYNSTKGALESLTRFLAKKYAGKGVLVNAVAPGPVLTETMEKYHPKGDFEAHYLRQMPIGRFLIPEDIGRAILFLSSELCSAVCGETLLCDGGRVKLSVK